MEYLKDKLNKGNTSYDIFSVDDIICGPQSYIVEIKKIYKEVRAKLYREKKHSHLKKISEAKDMLITSCERLKIDIFFYCVPKTQDSREGGENE